MPRSFGSPALDAGAGEEASLVLANDAADLRRLAGFVEEYARRVALPDKVSFAIQLCLEEAISNVIRHGAAAGAATRIVATLRRDGSEVTLCVEDDGAPFNPTLVAPPALAVSLDDVKIGGLGVHLMREFSSRMCYERTADTNRLHLAFCLAPQP